MNGRKWFSVILSLKEKNDLLEETIIHVAGHLFGTSSIYFVDLFSVRIIGVEASELALGVAEQKEEMWAVTAVDDVQDAVARLLIDDARKHHVFDGISE